MMQLIPAQNLNLMYLEEKFGLTQADDEQFFPEWLEDLPEVSVVEAQQLDRVKLNYLSLVKRRPITEEIVKMVVLSPLLDLAGFYLSPFDIETETTIEIYAENQAEIVKGRVDIMVLKQQLWLLLIESRQASFSLLTAIPQALALMLAHPVTDRPSFGLVTNGCDLIFLKLIKQDYSQYAFSDQFTLLKRSNELYDVLSILKNIGKSLKQ